MNEPTPTPETWRPVLGHEETYAVSDRGRVLSFHKGLSRFLAGAVDRDGYLCVKLYRNKRPIHRPVHQLVCEAWHGPRPDGLEVRHLDGEKLNLAPSNLKWGTQSENGFDRVRHGANFQANKTHCPQGHAYEGQNLVIERDGSRKCRICKNARVKVYADEHRDELNANARVYRERVLGQQTPAMSAAARAEQREREAANRERLRLEVNAERARQGLRPLVKNAEKTHCPQGHPYDEANTYVVPSSGVRQCKICRAEHARRLYERRKREAA